MKKALKLFGNLKRDRNSKVSLLIIALVAVIGFSMVACGDIEDPTGTGGTYTIAYNGNTDTGGTVPTDGTPYPSGATVTVLGNPGNLAKTGNTFAGWNTAANGSGASYNAGSTFTIYANTTLYAQWTPNSILTTLDGAWETSDGWQVTVIGNTGTVNALGSLSPLGQSALEKGYLSLNSTDWRNLKSTGNLTWSGEVRGVSYNKSNPAVATGVAWTNSTFTMSTNGQTLTVTGTWTTGPFTNTWTRKGYSLDGVWESSWGEKITVNGNTGVINSFGTPNPLGQSAIDKGYWTLNSQEWRNLTSTGNLIWSGEYRGFSYNTSSPNVATGVAWINATFTMSANGQTLTVTGTFTGTGAFTDPYTRIQ